MAIRPIDSFPTKIDPVSAAYPDGEGRNVTVPGDATGTPWDEVVINDIWGLLQKLTSNAGITPSGVPDTAVTSQYFNALQASAGYPGLIIEYAFNVDPGFLGLRLLKLIGGGILIANYPELEAAVYVGDAANAAVHAGGGMFYKSSDAAGTTPDILGPWMQIPDRRGYTPRGFDEFAIVDPDGASRFLGDVQEDAVQKHNHLVSDNAFAPPWGCVEGLINSVTSGSVPVYIPTFTNATGVSTTIASEIEIGEDMTDHYPPRVTPTGRVDTETRMANVSTNYAIWY